MNAILQKVAKFDAERDSGARAGGSIFDGGSKYLGGSGRDFQVKQGQTIQLSVEEYNEIFAGFLDEIKEPKPENKPNIPELQTPSLSEQTLTKTSEMPSQLEKMPTAETETILDSVDGKVLEREVNGKKTKISVATIDGQKVRREIKEDGSLGDELVTISTHGKNKYVTKSEMENQMKTALGLDENAELPSDIQGSYVSVGGNPVLIFKKDGKTMDQAELREYVSNLKVQTQASPVPEEVAAAEEIPVADGNSTVEQKDEVVINASEVKIEKHEVGPANDPNYEASRLSLVKEDFNANGQVGKISQGKYYINGMEVSKDVYDSAKASATANDTVKPENTKLTPDEINAKIADLKPGEEFKYQYSSGYSLGSSSFHESKPIKWKREDDGTLTKTTREFVYADNGTVVLNLSEHYSADGKTLLDKDTNAKSLVCAKELKSTIHYQNGKTTDITTDLTNVDKHLLKRGLYGSYDSASRLLSSLTNQAKIDSDKFSSQEFRNTDGESVVIFKDNKFFNEKGKEIDFDKAHKILSKLNESGKLGSLVQIYQNDIAE